jgi:hypothetical protein
MIQTSTVVAAVPWNAFDTIWLREPPRAMAETVAHAARMEPSPIVTVNLWFDGHVIRDRFIGLIGGPMHWVFDKSAIFGAAAGHLSVVSSGAAALAPLGNAELTKLAVDQMARALPEASSRKLLRSVVVREHSASFSIAPGAPSRPGTRTGVPGLFLAGDWTDTGLPATIEGAVQSGHHAADAVLGTGA